MAPRVKGVKKRRVITLQEKLNIINLYEEGQSLSLISRNLGFATSTVNSIIKDKARIMEHVKGSTLLQSTIISKQRAGVIYEMEKMLSVWIHEQNQRGEPLSRCCIQIMAKNLYEDLKAEKGETEGSFIASDGWFNRFRTRANLHDMKLIQCRARQIFEELKKREGTEDEKFNASRGWLERFKKRSNLRNMKLSEDVINGDTTENFLSNLLAIIEKDGYTPNQVFNIKETEIFWGRMPNKTFIIKENKQEAEIEISKNRLTVLLGGNASGDFKMKPLLVYHCENSPALKNYPKEHILCKPNKKACITFLILKDWLTNCAIPSWRTYCEEKQLDFKILLIIDNALAEIIDSSDLNELPQNVKLFYLPHNISSMQPMDLGIISSFKANYLRRTFQNFISGTNGDKSSLDQFWRQYDIRLAVSNILESWMGVTQNCIIETWSKIWSQKSSVDISNQNKPKVEYMETSNNTIIDEDKLKEEVENVQEEILKLSGIAEFREIKQEEINDVEFLDSRDDLLSNGTFHEDSQENSNGEDTEMTETYRTLSTKRLLKAFQLIEEGLNIFIQDDPQLERSMNVYKRVFAEYNCYREIYQQKIGQENQQVVDDFVKVDFKQEICDQPSTSST